MNDNYDGRPVKIERAIPPFVVAIDIGSGSTRCALYDSLARPVRGRTSKADHLFTERADGTAIIDPDQVVAEAAQTISTVTADLERASVAAVAMDTFASSLIPVDSYGDALTDCITYADTRSASQLTRLRAELDENAMHQVTGTRLHTSYTPSRLLWLSEEHPEIVRKTARYYSLGEYVFSKLAGIEGAATSTVAWAGLLNRKTLEIDSSLLEVTGARESQFAPVLDPDQPVRAVSPSVAKQWPALDGAAWFPAIPDGYASNLGVGATGPSAVALSAATSGAMRTIVPGTPEHLPSGLWSYTVSRSESIVGGALNDVGRVALWLETTLAPLSSEEINATLSAPAQVGVPLVLPFLTGERSTGWAGSARGVLTGVSSACGAPCLWRGTMEGVALSYARMFAQILQINPGVQQVIGSGGVGGHYPGFMDLLTQALGVPLAMADAKRVTMRGAAVLALSVLWPDADVAQIPLSRPIVPDPRQRPYFEQRLEEFEDVYRRVMA